jgi:hypothetical protein
MMAMMILLVGSFLDEPRPSPPGVWERVVTARPSAIALPVDLLGPGWKAGGGVAIDDLESLDGLEEPVRQVARLLKERLSPLGVRAVGDHTLVRTEPPLNSVTVRLFLFQNGAQCRAWWQERYQYPGWEEQYRSVESEEFLVLESREMPRRIVVFGNAALTAHQIGEGDAHVKAIDHVIHVILKK